MKLTAEQLEAIREVFVNADADTYVGMPGDPEEYAEAVREIVEKN